jgi:hypothetical protein
MGGLLSECCNIEDVEWIALGSAERVVIGPECPLWVKSRHSSSYSITSSARPISGSGMVLIGPAIERTDPRRLTVPLVIPLILGVLLRVVLGRVRPDRERIDPRC